MSSQSRFCDWESKIRRILKRLPHRRVCHHDLVWWPSQVSAGSIFDTTASALLLPDWQRRTLDVLGSLPFLFFTTAVTLVAIFESDLRLAATPAAADQYFTILASLVFAEFAIELVQFPCNPLGRLRRRMHVVACGRLPCHSCHEKGRVAASSAAVACRW